MEALDGLGSGAFDVDEAFMNLHFEGFTAGFVDMRGFDDGKGRALGWKRYGTGNGRAGADSGVDDLTSALVDDAVVISLEADANF